ncbi:hypothetical protein AXG93_1847s1190 [Marchantia polymorpha subsp. ruderalis]|uniref:Uncharacterized protein n=1 Tax=Marchantia polymorpha subsp. ruderalis TaxID=1480154 RepID=A0A176VFC8_MARPO|nr:hypothetical protein AXG93_1847s1190 [Marchantia polymorpha subsp. ruderalis]
MIAVEKLFTGGGTEDPSSSSRLLSEEIASSEYDKSPSHEQLDSNDLLDWQEDSKDYDRSHNEEDEGVSGEVKGKIQKSFLDDFCSEVVMKYKTFKLDVSSSPKGSILSLLSLERMAQITATDVIFLSMLTYSLPMDLVFSGYSRTAIQIPTVVAADNIWVNQRTPVSSPLVSFRVLP